VTGHEALVLDDDDQRVLIGVPGNVAEHVQTTTWREPAGQHQAAAERLDLRQPENERVLDGDVVRQRARTIKAGARTSIADALAEAVREAARLLHLPHLRLLGRHSGGISQPPCEVAY